jgi:hypothetical protein
MLPFVEFIGSTQSYALKAILRQWDMARGANLLPSFEQLQLATLSQQVKRMWVYRYADGRFTGWLADEQLSKALGKSFQGLPLEEAHSAQAYLWVHAAMTRVVTEPAIFRSGGNLYRSGSGQLIPGERIALPLADDGVHANGVLGVSDYRDPQLQGPFELLNEQEDWLSLA